MKVRPEAAGDHEAVERLNDLAFKGPAEAAIVRALRGDVEPLVSLVADDGGEVVGHILFSPVTVDGPEGEFRAMGLGPMSVTPHRQRSGIGSALVRAGLAECRAIGESVVIVLGHPAYYPRFGFVPAATKGIRWEREVPDEVFMVLELSRGALAGRTGVVRYHPAFEAAE